MDNPYHLGVWKIDSSRFSVLLNMLTTFHENRSSRFGGVRERTLWHENFNKKYEVMLTKNPRTSHEMTNELRNLLLGSNDHIYFQILTSDTYSVLRIRLTLTFLNLTFTFNTQAVLNKTLIQKSFGKQNDMIFLLI